MDKKSILDRYKKAEDKLLISKFLDKIESVRKTNKIETTDFLNEIEQNILKKVINLIEFKNFEFYGGMKDSERKIVVVYPEKMKDLFTNKTFKYDTILSVFRINFDQYEELNYSHGVYLGGIIKLGLKREKIGDILVNSNGADIIVKKESEKFLYANLASLTRFKNAYISTVLLEDINVVEKKFDNIKIITSSLRLDNIVAELAKTSRNGSNEILKQERVFVNYENETKGTKIVKEKDVVTVRGKGKFIIDEIAGNTKKGNFVIIVKKFI